jgi:uncharacterized OB-fold protein
MSTVVNPFDLIQEETDLALKFFLTDFGKRFYDGLREGKLILPYCEKCKKYNYPPRPFCYRCESSLFPREGPSGLFTLRGFTQQHRALRFVAPDVIGIVEHPELFGRIAGRITEPFESLQLGDQLEFFAFKIVEGLFVPGFRKPAPRS